MVSLTEAQKDRIQEEFERAGRMVPHKKARKALAKRLNINEIQLYNRFKYLRRKEPGHSRHKGDDHFVHHPLSASHSPPAAAPSLLHSSLSPSTPPAALPTPLGAPSPLPINIMQPLEELNFEAVAESFQAIFSPLTEDVQWDLMLQEFLAIEPN